MKTVCITGVSRGIGNGLARAYLERGDRVFGTVRDVNASGVKELQAEFAQTFTPVKMDVSDRSSVEEAAGELQRQADAIDLLINNAGMSVTPDEQRIEDISEEDVQRVFNVNTLGPLRTLQALLPLLREGTDPKVVMISSSAGSISGQGGGRGVPYCVSKGALNMLSKLLSFHCRDERMAIVALHPGWVRTDMGGPGGALSVEESVAGMMKVIDQQTTESPIYVDYAGREMAW
ncbi:MAG: SDR family NAD(P)-dependent oxidoreductase [Spirochaetes bacterium]|jgi:NAD(P)-dependent dehydrogenase (short-subunit alcohol dehydrogenase family)|nr:SDR family NAD(P)-dependent oxidoreductase [Spirochaetota bacterium]